jgi:fatty acid CoA ligase FadD36
VSSVPELVPLSELPDLDDIVTIDGQSISTAELDAAVAALAAEIAGAPAAAVLATATLGTAVGVLAGIRAGVPVVPVPSDAGPIERRHIVGDSGASLMILPAGSGEARPGGADRRLATVAAETLAERPPIPSPNDGLPPDTVLIMYTSGTTGPPKGVPITAGAVLADLDALAGAWAWTPDDVLVHGLPLCHVHGLILGMLGPLRARSRLVHTGRPTPESYAAAAEEGGTLFFGVPTIWGRVAADHASARAMRNARLMVSGSAGLPPPVSEALRQACGHSPVERYGMTETLITLAQRAGEEPRPGWVGRRVAGVDTRLCNEDGELLPADGHSIGSLEVRGPTVMRGYLHHPAADRAAFGPDGWFRTGDAAVTDESGEHRILGRMASDLIKSGGHRIGAGEVEATLLAHGAVREVAVVGVPDDDLGQAVVAYVVADGVSAEQLVEYVARELSNHKRPRRIHFVEALPRNSMGKVRKDLLS